MSIRTDAESVMVGNENRDSRISSAMISMDARTFLCCPAGTLQTL